MGAVASFYFDGCCTCPVPEWDSAGGWTPWLLLSLRSSGSWGWDSPFESVWEDLGVAFQTHPGSQASSRGEAKDSALLPDMGNFLPLSSGLFHLLLP